MDAARSESAVVFGGARAATMAMLFAATHPDRTKALILYAPVAKTVSTPDFPYGKTPEEQQVLVRVAEIIRKINYGTVVLVIQDGKVVQIEMAEKVRLR